MSEDAPTDAAADAASQDVADAPAEVDQADGARPKLLRYWPLAVLLVVIGLGVALAAASSGERSAVNSTTTSPTTPLTYVLSGTLRLDEDKPLYETGSYCRGTGGYADIREGTQVTVTDGEGVIRAIGSLGPGYWTTNTVDPKCLFGFSVTNVPRLDIYQVEVAHRGKLAFTHSDLASQGFTVAVTLGD